MAFAPVPLFSAPGWGLAALLAVGATSAVAADTSRLAEWCDRMQPIFPRSYVVRHTDTPITIDGRLDDSAWADVPWTEDFVDIEGSAKPPPRFRTRAKLCWDDEYLYVGAELTEPHVWGTLTQHDAVIFQDPDFEVFLDPDGDTHRYFEFELNALNTGWDLSLDKPYQDGGPAHNEWEIPGLKTAVHVVGTLNDARDRDTGWTLEIAFPWRVLAAGAAHPGPPTEGEQWRMNFSRVEWQITTEGGRYAKVPKTPEDNWVWSPQGVIDMHRPEMWGVVQFTRRPVGEEITVTPIPGKAARDVALACYHAQRDFFKTHRHWAATTPELGWSPPPGGSAVERPVLEPTTDGYVFAVPFLDGPVRRAWCIRQDRRLTLETIRSESQSRPTPR